MSAATGNITAIKKGLMLCIDPSSGGQGSHVGYALFDKGILIEAGEINMSDHWDQPVSVRLFHLSECLKQSFTTEVDLLVVEKIRSVSRGRAYTANHQLMWSVGAIQASIPHKKTVEIHPRTWQGVVSRTWLKYSKSDMNDSIGIGCGMIALAYGYTPKKINNKSQQDLLESTIKPKIKEALT